MEENQPATAPLQSLTRDEVTISSKPSMVSSSWQASIADCGEKFLQHIERLIRDSINSWQGNNSEKDIVSVALCTKVVEYCIALGHESPSAFRKSVMSISEGICSTLRYSNSRHVNDLVTENVSYLWQQFCRRGDEGRSLFTTIQTHHASIASDSPWEKAISETPCESLSAYAVAATEMGGRKWVQQGNAWMLNNVIKFFRQGWAAKLYVRRENQKHYELTGSWLDKAEVDAISHRLSYNLMDRDSSSASAKIGVASTSDKLIRLLDVGSCYNPFVCGKYDGQQFVDVAVGESDSAPVIDQLGASVTSSGSRSLRQLPANGFDVVCMSLVLSYLPSPEARLAMIRKARSLLIDPERSRPHKAGMLVIFEKVSIFPVSGKYCNPITGQKMDRMQYVDSWKAAICQEGFDFVKFEILKYGERQAFGFVFSTKDFNRTPDDGSIKRRKIDDAATSEICNHAMWIKGDFVRSLRENADDPQTILDFSDDEDNAR